MLLSNLWCSAVAWRLVSNPFQFVMLTGLLLFTAESELKYGRTTGVAKQTLESTHLWCAQQYAIALITAGQHQQAKQFLQQVCLLFSVFITFYWSLYAKYFRCSVTIARVE